MYCHNCGKEVRDGSKFCTSCGAKLNVAAEPDKTADTTQPSGEPTGTRQNYNAYQPYNQVYDRGYNQPPYAQPATKTNVYALLGFIFSFFVTIVGLILSIIGYKKADAEYNGDGKSLALAGIIVSAVTMVLAFLALIILVIFAATISYNAQYNPM